MSENSSDCSDMEEVWQPPACDAQSESSSVALPAIRDEPPHLQPSPQPGVHQARVRTQPSAGLRNFAASRGLDLDTLPPVSHEELVEAWGVDIEGNTAPHQLESPKSRPKARPFQPSPELRQYAESHGMDVDALPSSSLQGLVEAWDRMQESQREAAACRRDVVDWAKVLADRHAAAQRAKDVAAAASRRYRQLLADLATGDSACAVHS